MNGEMNDDDFPLGSPDRPDEREPDEDDPDRCYACGSRLNFEGHHWACPHFDPTDDPDFIG